MNKSMALDGCDVRTRDRNAASRDGSAARAIDLFMTGPLGAGQSWAQRPKKKRAQRPAVADPTAAYVPPHACHDGR